MNRIQKFKKQQEKKQKEIYDRHGMKLVDLVESMEQEGLEPVLAVALMLDKAIDLTFYVCNTETDARKCIGLMTEQKSGVYKRGHNENN